MSNLNRDRKPNSSAQVIYQFLGGAGLGSFIVAIFISYGSPQVLDLGQVGLAVGFVLLCGILSGIGGKKFIDVVMKGLDSTALQELFFHFALL